MRTLGPRSCASRRGRGLIALADPAADLAAALPLAAPWRPGGLPGAARRCPGPPRDPRERGRRRADPGRRVGRPDGADPTRRRRRRPPAKPPSNLTMISLAEGIAGQRSSRAMRVTRRSRTAATALARGMLAAARVIGSVGRPVPAAAATRRPRPCSSSRSRPPGGGTGTGNGSERGRPGSYPGLGNLGPLARRRVPVEGRASRAWRRRSIRAIRGDRAHARAGHASARRVQSRTTRLRPRGGAAAAGWGFCRSADAISVTRFGASATTFWLRPPHP